MSQNKFNFENANNELQKHKIVSIKAKKVRSRYPRLYGKNSRLPEHSYGIDFLVYEITTNKGAQGWGIKKHNPQTLGKSMDNLFVGKSVSDIFNVELGIIDETAMSLDFALHDLAGKILNIPVYMMFGEKVNDVYCYDGAIYMNDISPDSKPGGLSKILEDCKQDYDMGYRDFKVKIGRGGMWMDSEEGLLRDIEVTRMIRKNYPESRIMVDGNDAFTVNSLFRYLDAVKDCNLFWIEEPFKENREDLLRLKDYLAKNSPNTLIADGEFAPNVNEVMSLAEEGLLDVILMDTADYGFTNWRKLIKRIEEKNLLASPHCWGQKLKTHYTSHIATAYKNVLTIEGVPDNTEGVDFDDYVLKEGILSVPDKAGFGMDLIWGREVNE
jgi:L-alanine-DL-glutamate epimerase-like enolase superfamily enzyme